MNIWVKPTRENLQKMCDALLYLNYEDELVKTIRHFDAAKPFLFRLGEKPNDIEVFNFRSGVVYADAEPHKIPFSFDTNTSSYFIGLRDLILNKTLASR